MTSTRKAPTARGRWVSCPEQPGWWWLDPPTDGGSYEPLRTSRRQWRTIYGSVPDWIAVWLAPNGTICRLERKVKDAGLERDPGCWEEEFPPRNWRALARKRGWR